MRTVVILQARVASTRLPGKVLLDVMGRPMLARQIERLLRSTKADEIVVATTDDEADAPLATLADECGVRWYRGDADDVLRRYVNAAQEAAADVVVRTTGDCPLIDPGVLDHVIEELITHHADCDYASNVICRNYPRGLDTEAMFVDVLERMERLAISKPAREHVRSSCAPNAASCSSHATFAIRLTTRICVGPSTTSVTCGWFGPCTSSLIWCIVACRIMSCWRSCDRIPRWAKSTRGLHMDAAVNVRWLFIPAAGPARVSGILRRCAALEAIAPAALAHAEASLLPPEERRRQWASIIPEQQVSWVIVDGYSFTPDDHRAIQATGRQLLVIDDYHHLADYHADLIVNPNAGAESLIYRGSPVGRRALGVEYAIISPEVLQVRQGVSRCAETGRAVDRHHRRRQSRRIARSDRGGDRSGGRSAA